MSLVQRYPDAVPQLSHALAGRTGASLWERLDLQNGVLTAGDPAPSVGERFGSEDPLNVGRLLSTAYSTRTADKKRLLDNNARSGNWEAISRWGRMRALAFVVDPAISGIGHVDIQYGIYAAWVRDGVIKELAERLSVPPQELEDKVPKFFIEEDVRELDKQTGYDRYGMLGTLRKEALVTLLSTKSYLYYDESKEAVSDMIEAHFRKIMQHYASMNDLTADELGVELKAMAQEMRGVSHMWNSRRWHSVQMGVHQMLVVRAIQLGERFRSIKEVDEYLRAMGVASIGRSNDVINSAYGKKKFSAMIIEHIESGAVCPTCGLRH